MAHNSGDDRYSVTIVDIDDPAAANAGSELFDFHAVQLQSRPFKIRRIIVRLDTATVVYHSTNVPVRTRTRLHAGLLAYVTYGPQAVGAVNGLPVRPGLLLSVPSGTDHLLVTGEDFESIAFLLPSDDVRAHLMVRGRGAEFHVPERIEPLQVDPAKVDELFEWGKRLVSAALLRPTMFDDASRERTAAREDLFEIVLSTVSVADGFESTRADRTRVSYGHVVRLAEDYAMAQGSERLYITDLCRITGVSERTLEYAFKEVMGLAPMAYLARLRLHRVRQALLAATNGPTTVAAAAVEWGFWHFGEFSRAYKECFGELPSETLRRRDDQPPDREPASEPRQPPCC